MAMTIWKYPLRLTDVQSIEMPLGAEIIAVAEQYGALCLWAWVNDDPDAKQVKRQIAIVGTGNPAPGYHEALHIGTVVTAGGSLVWHVFERPAR